MAEHIDMTQLFFMNIKSTVYLKVNSLTYFALLLKRFRKHILLLALGLLHYPLLSDAQEGNKNGVVVNAIIIDKDTFALTYLKEVVIYDNLTDAQRRKLNRKARREERRQDRNDAAYAKLRYNVYKVYPYAQTAAFLLKDVHTKLDRLPNEAARKKYLKSLEKELNKRFKGELSEFTISQGIVLVKLINRQTGRSCFDIIQEVKGGFNAVVWQGIALVFNNNLRREYDPVDKDKDIEEIVLELEAYAKRAKK